MRIEYIRDEDVSDELDLALRELLSRSFRDEDGVFLTRRFYKEPPLHRYLLWDEQQQLAGHIAVHEKQVQCDGKVYRIAGIAEVCTHEQYRHQGWVKRMLQHIHAQRRELGDDFACLFGDTQYYQSSGYREANTLQLLNDEQQWQYIEQGMYCELNQAWPSGDVRLVGITF